MTGGWSVKALGDLFEISRGGSPRPIQDFLTEDVNGVNWIMISDASASGKYIERTAKRIRPEGVARSRQVSPGDFLLTNSMSFGRPYIMKTEGCIHDGWLHLKKRDKSIDEDYFYYLLGSEATYAKFERVAAGATVKNLNIDLVSSVKVPVPPLLEQRRIATILDKADSLRRKRQEAIRLADEFLRAAYLDLAQRHPARATVESLLAVVPNAARTGPFGSQLLVSEFTESGIPVLGIDNVVSNAFTWAAPRFISSEKYAELERYTVRPGDVMVTIMGTTGRVAIAPDDLPTCISTKHLCTLTLDRKKMLPTYLWAGLRWDPEVKAQTRREAKGAIMEGWNMGIVKGLLVNAPPMDVQLKFEEIAGRIKRMSSVQALAEKGTDELMASLSAKYLEPTT